MDNLSHFLTLLRNRTQTKMRWKYPTESHFLFLIKTLWGIFELSDHWAINCQPTHYADWEQILKLNPKTSGKSVDQLAYRSPLALNNSLSINHITLQCRVQLFCGPHRPSTTLHQQLLKLSLVTSNNQFNFSYKNCRSVTSPATH